MAQVGKTSRGGMTEGWLTLPSCRGQIMPLTIGRKTSKKYLESYQVLVFVLVQVLPGIETREVIILLSNQ